MGTASDTFYRLAPGVDVVRLGAGKVLLRSDALAVRLEGESAQFFADRIIPLLTGDQSLTEVSARVAVGEEELRSYLDDLVERMVLRRSPHVQDAPSHPYLKPFLTMLEELGIDAAEATERLRQATVGILGLEAHGAHLASILTTFGVGTLVLADPYPCEPGNLVLMPPTGHESVGLPRQDVLKAALKGHSATHVKTYGTEPLTSELVDIIARESEVLVVSFDKAFSSASVWANRASRAWGTPAIYAQLRGHLALVGPLVLPDRTACYMCWRMRSVACQEDFEEAMAYEERLDQRRHPLLHERGVLPFLSSYAASILAGEVMKLLLGIATSSLAGKVHEFDGLTLKGANHTVLQMPSCPVCKKKAYGEHRPS